MTQQLLDRLLELMAHTDPALQAQGDELLLVLAQEDCQSAFLMALESGNSDLALRIAGGTDPVLIGWMRRRAWAAAATRLSETYTAAGHALPGPWTVLLRELNKTLSQAATATNRVQVGGLRHALLETLRQHPAVAPSGVWLTPAEVLFRDLTPEDSCVARALDVSATALAAHLHRRSLQMLRPWSAMKPMVRHIAELALLQLPTHPDVHAGARRQLLLRRDRAVMKTQRRLCQGLEQEQRSLGDTMLTAREQQLQAWWRDTIQQLGASPGSWLFSR